MAKTVECPECGCSIEIEVDVLEGEIIECPDCAVELEVVSLDPLEVKLAPEEDEDWGE
jgi:alpha-aminoadipate carrier protein LysW